MFFEEVLYDFASDEKLFLNQDDIYNENGIIIGKYNFTEIIDDSKVCINLISIYPKYRRQRYFSKLMKAICLAADQNNLILELIPMPTNIKDSPAGDVGMFKLKAIYMSYGFNPEYEDMDISIFSRKSIRPQI